MDKETALREMFLRRYFDWLACDKIYRKHLKIWYFNWWFKSGQGEDSEFNWKMFLASRKIISQPLFGYHYCMNDESMTHRPFSDEFLAVPKRFMRYAAYAEEKGDQVLRNTLWDYICSILLEYDMKLYDDLEANPEPYQKLRAIMDQVPRDRADYFRSQHHQAFLLFSDPVKAADNTIIRENNVCSCVTNRNEIRKYIYGCGRIGREVAGILNKRKIPFTAFAVSDKKGLPNGIMGHPVIQIDDIDHPQDCAVFLALNYNNMKYVKEKCKSFKSVTNLGKYSVLYR